MLIDNGWYEADETRAALGIKERTLRTWVQNGRIRTKFTSDPQGRRTRLYKADDVEKLKNTYSPAPLVTRAKEARREPVAIAPPKSQPKAEAFDILKALELLTRRAVAAPAPRPAEFLSVAESAAYLRLPKAYVQRAVTEGRIPAIKAGGWKIQRASLEAFTG